MGIEAATYIGDLVTSNPTSIDVRSQGDDHLRLIKSVLQTTFPDGNKPIYFPKSLSKSANYVVLNTDDNTVIRVDASGGAISITLPTPTNAGWGVTVMKVDSSANAVTIVGTVNGAVNPTLTQQYEAGVVKWNGSSFVNLQKVCPSGSVSTSSLIDGSVTTAKLAALAVTTATIADANVTYGKIQNVANGKFLGNFSGGAAAASEYGLNSELEVSSSNLRAKQPLGIKYVFTASGSSTYNVGTAYNYSSSTAPTESKNWRSDDATLTYTARNAANVLRVRWRTDASNSDPDAGVMLWALFRDVTGSSSAIAWGILAQDTGAKREWSFETIVTIPDTNAHTYKVGILAEGQTNEPTQSMASAGTRRLFTIEELIAL